MTSTPVNQLCEIGRTDQPRRLLPSESEHTARQHLRRSPAPSLLEAQAKVFRTNARKRDVGFSKLSQQPEISAIHGAGLLWGDTCAQLVATQLGFCKPSFREFLRGVAPERVRRSSGEFRDAHARPPSYDENIFSECARVVYGRLRTPRDCDAGALRRFAGPACRR